ncbi:hypothetical protein BGZ58_006351 [Dissophora ornata]|nr:hypothetical protein BGZ58_006351 [Dissophora ornata]
MRRTLNQQSQSETTAITFAYRHKSSAPLPSVIHGSPEKQLIKAICPTVDTAPLDPDLLMSSIILTPRDKDVATLNSMTIDMLYHGQDRIYKG